MWCWERGTGWWCSSSIDVSSCWGIQVRPRNIRVVEWISLMYRHNLSCIFIVRRSPLVEGQVSLAFGLVWYKGVVWIAMCTIETSSGESWVNPGWVFIIWGRSHGLNKNEWVWNDMDNYNQPLKTPISDKDNTWTGAHSRPTHNQPPFPHSTAFTP